MAPSMVTWLLRLAALICVEPTPLCIPPAFAQQQPGDVVVVPVPQPARRPDDLSSPPKSKSFDSPSERQATAGVGPLPPSRDLEFNAWLAATWPAAQALGVKQQVFDQATRGLQPDLSIPDLVLPKGQAPPRSSGQAEFVKPPKDYLSEASLTRLAAQGRELAAKHADLLSAIHRRFGTPPAIILALWGRESAFGAYRLPHNAIRVLATQAYVGRRNEFFYNEFLLALRLLSEGHVALKDMRSSWAGAMGPTQFLPSDFYKFAVDFDGDGRADVWNSVSDSLASAANQLVQYGWQRDEPWGFESFPQGAADCTEAVPKLKRPLSEWLKLGYKIERQFVAGWLDKPASLVMPAGTLGPAFLGLRNYDAIRNYNTADVYVLFVGNLADRISGGAAFKGQWTSVIPMPATDVEKLQTSLLMLGFYDGRIDGQAGPLTRVAIGQYQKSRKLAVTCWPDRLLLSHMGHR